MSLWERTKTRLLILVVAAGAGTLWLGGYSYLLDHGRAEDTAMVLPLIPVAIVASAVWQLAYLETEKVIDRANYGAKKRAQDYQFKLGRATKELEAKVERLEISVDEKWTELNHLRNMTSAGAIEYWEPKIWAELSRLAVVTEALREEVSRYAGGMIASTEPSIDGVETDELARVESVVTSLRQINGEFEHLLAQKVAAEKEESEERTQEINFLLRRLGDAEALYEHDR